MARDKQALRAMAHELDKAHEKLRDAKADMMRIEYDIVRYLVDHEQGAGLKLDRNWLNAVTRS